MAKPKRLPIDDSEDESKIPIPNLPKKYLSMHANSGTKIRNVLGYALREFPNHSAVVWSGAGQGIGKVISCAELFKRKVLPIELHQVTKLRYVEAKNLSTEEPQDENTKIHRVPEIYILLSREATNTKEPGYQAPGDVEQFLSLDNEKQSESRNNSHQVQSSSKVTETEKRKLAVDVNFKIAQNRTGRKRPMKKQQANQPSKKNKKKGSDNR